MRAMAAAAPRAAVRGSRTSLGRKRCLNTTTIKAAAPKSEVTWAAADVAAVPEPERMPPAQVITTTVSSTRKTVDKSKIPFDNMRRFNMHQTFPGVPRPRPASALERPGTLVTTLPNGLRVASQETYGQLCTFGVLVDAGSRHETDTETGTCHLMELTAFKSTERRSQREVVREIEDMGGLLTASVGREQSLLCVDVLRDALVPAMDVLADCVLHPRLADAEVDEQRDVVALQIAEMPPEMLLKEALQGAAYPGQQLGRPHYCPEGRIADLSAQKLRAFRARNFVAPKTVLAGAGVGHDELVRLAEQFLLDMPAEAPEGSDGGGGSGSGGGGGAAAAAGTAAATGGAAGTGAASNAAASEVAAAANLAGLSSSSSSPLIATSGYTGGEVRLAGVGKEELVRVAVAFETCGWRDDAMVVPVCVLQILLGGGDSFSAGGPGKGMYSRLYREVLNRYYWVEAAEAFTAIHNESGLLGIAGASQPEHAARLMRIFCEHFARLLGTPVGGEELARARNMLKCNLLTQLESRIVLFEDIGRQMLTYNERQLPEEVCRRIDAVTAEDIMAVARHALSQPPAVAAIGQDLSRVPDYQQICSWFAA
ncbi:unnamed protein product [Phaeothamnion confervicola]